jgi:hypothetical protein
MAQPLGVPGGASSRRWGRWSDPLVVGLLLVGILFAGWATAMAYGGPAWGYDLAAYLGAAHRIGIEGTPYQPETLGGPFRPGPGGLYLYSPVLAAFLRPLVGLSSPDATLLWLLLRVAALVLLCGLMPVSGRIRLATLALALFSLPVLDDLRLGNVSLIVTLLAVMLWRALDRPIGSVALAASLTLRPTMGVILLWWLLRGRARPILWTLLAGIVIVGLSLPLVGPEAYLEYMRVLVNISDLMGVRMNGDLGSSALLLGTPPWIAQVALFAGYALALAAVLVSLRRDRELSYVVTLGATLLLSPLLWGHYLTNLLIPAAFLAARGRPWGLALPLLGWLPLALLPAAAVAGMLLPLVARDRGEPAGSPLTILSRPTRSDATTAP